MTKYKFAKASVWQKMNKPRKFTSFNKVEKVCILLITIVGGFFFGAFMLYATDPSITKSGGPLDPFSTLWNGQAYGIDSSGFVTNSFRSSDGDPPTTASCDGLATTCTILNVPVKISNLLMISVRTRENTNPTSVTDTVGNSYTLKDSINSGGTQGPGVSIWYATAISTATINVTATWATNRYSQMDISVYSNFNTFGNTASDFSLTSVSPSSSTITVTTTTSGNILYEIWAYMNNGMGTSTCSTSALNSGQSLRRLFPSISVPGGGGCMHGITLDKTLSSGGSQSLNVSWSGGTTGSGNTLIHYALELKASATPVTCLEGYRCFLTQGDSTGDMVLNANSTHSAVALSNSKVDLSPGSNKALAFSFTNSPGISSYYDGEIFAWFLRSNSTLPTERNWTPINDTSVSLALIIYVRDTSPAQYDYYLYMQRQKGQPLNLTIGTDPYPTCPQSSTLYLCAQSTSSSHVMMQAVLNFTGGAQPSSTTRGTSYICTDLGSGSYSCVVGASGNQQITYANTIQQLNYTLPWLNLQDNYNVGYWQYKKANANSIKILTNREGSDHAIISYFVPGGEGQVETGGFFGWVGRSLGGAWNFIGSGLNSVLGPVINFGNNLMSAFIAALSQALALFAKGLEQVLNFLGGLFGIPTLGTQIVTALAALATAIVSGATTVFGFFAWLATLLLGGIFSIISAAVTIWITIMGFAATVWTLILQLSFSISFLLFLDFCFGLYQLYVRGMNGFWWWIHFNIVLFTFVFTLTGSLINLATDSLLRMKQILAQWL